MTFAVRKLKKSDDYRQIEAIQRAAWALDDLTIVPAHLLEAMACYNAGYLIGAFADDGAVGFMLILSTNDPKIQHMHMIGVDPSWQSGHRGIHVGLEMLRFYAQEIAIPQGVQELEWTYDPLVGRNSNLYIRKIGGDVVRYDVEAYSTTSEEGVRGLPNDRLLVRWKVTDPLHRSNGVEVPSHVVTDAEEIHGPRFALAVPLDILALKAKDLAEARRERLRTRAVFQAALRRGYKVTGFVNHAEPQAGNWFIFEQQH